MRRSLKQRRENVKEMEIIQEDGTMIGISIPFLKRRFYPQYTLPVGSAQKYLHQIVQYELSRRECSTLLPTGDSSLQVV